MTKFSKIALPALAAALGLAAVPASAHDTGRQDDRYGERHDANRYTPARHAAIRSDIRDLERQIDRAAARHQISWREAQGLKRQVGQLDNLYARYARNGLTAYEVRTLQAKVRNVAYDLRAERRDRDSRRG